ncbi:hypothetical protein [Thiolapillus sp.]|uniref:hypothetical protein n=1 Tax=Thiolapillus sp. TaxID=2017437 RepID=UPI003AF60863
MKIQYKTLHGWVSCLLPGQAEAFLASCVARYGYIRGRGDVVRLLRQGLVLRYGDGPIDLCRAQWPAAPLGALERGVMVVHARRYTAAGRVQ